MVLAPANPNDGGSGGGGGGEAIPAKVSETVEQIKEIVCDYSEGEIYAMLQESGMDPNETTQKLLSQDPFHEVKRKMDKKKEEKRLLLPCESQDSSPKFVDVDGQPSDHPNPSHACMDKLQPDNSCVQVPNSPLLNAIHKDEDGTVETFKNLPNKAVISGSSVSEACSSSQPDFSILEGEICLDDFSIRELQEAFRATFGRQISVKNELWLKRRIAMGLTNSCEIPTTKFTIKDHQIIHKKVNQDSCMTNMSETGLLSYQVAALSNAGRQDAPTNTTFRGEEHVKDRQVVSGKKLSKPRSIYDTRDGSFENCRRKRVRKPTRRFNEEFSDAETKDESFENRSSKRIRKPTMRYKDELSDVEAKDEGFENCFSKRVRKPTKRYVEELSDVETMEGTGRSSSSLENSGLGQPSSESRIRSMSDGTGFVMRQHSFGGSKIKIPHAPRLRRRRPRKNFVAFTNFVNMENEKSDLETLNSLELDMDQGNSDSAGNNCDNSTNTASTFNICSKRMHHRAWSISEVLKLVDGVARYGAGKWSEIKRLAFASSPYRTSVDLKDKWRNLLRASFTEDSFPKSGRNSGNNISMPIPNSILSRIRELAEMHSQSGIEFRPTRYVCDVERNLQERSGFI